MGATRETAKRILEYLNELPRQQMQNPEAIRSAVGMESDVFESATKFLRDIDAITLLLSGSFTISSEGIKFLENYDKATDIITREEIDIINARIRKFSEEMLTEEKLTRNMASANMRAGIRRV